MGDFSYSIDTHPESGWQTVHLGYHSGAKSTSATFTPDMGANLFQFAVDGVEYLQDFRQSASGDVSLAGMPILYPSPNRMRGAQFIFDGELYAFEPNNGPNFSHGFVRHARWQWEEPVAADDGVSARCWIRLDQDSPWFEPFPIYNTLSITYTLMPSALRMELTVQNEDERRRLPFGLAVHPFFRIHGPRRSVYIQAPGEKWMEAVDRLPTGQLIDMEDSEADLRTATSLEALALDDVIWGMKRERPASVFYEELGKRVVLWADGFFTHAVVYTPQGQPYFCIENQSCSADAHNLHAHGYEEEAHLAILYPGELLTTWVEFQVEDL